MTTIAWIIIIAVIVLLLVPAAIHGEEAQDQAAPRPAEQLRHQATRPRRPCWWREAEEAEARAARPREAERAEERPARRAPARMEEARQEDVVREADPHRPRHDHRH